jgi:hypothetical protein
VLNSEKDLYDLTINCEDLLGSEVLSVILTRGKANFFYQPEKQLHAIEPDRRKHEQGVGDPCALQFVKGVEEFTIGL